MNFKFADNISIIRCSQKDEYFLELYKTKINDIIRLSGNKKLNKHLNYIHPLAEFLYYGLTSLSNRQTLGEEYTGILRFCKSHNDIPNKQIHLIWLLLHIGGNALFERSLKHIKAKLRDNKKLTVPAKSFFQKIIDFLLINKESFIRFNQSLFYTDGSFYQISNRLTGIQYIFLRHWMGDESSSKTIRILGKLVSIYIIINIINKFYELDFNESSNYNSSAVNECVVNESNLNECIICAELTKNMCALPCGHVCCWNCMFLALRDKNKCFLCRTPVKTSRIVLLQNY